MGNQKQHAEVNIYVAISIRNRMISIEVMAKFAAIYIFFHLSQNFDFQVKAHHAYLLDILEQHGVAKLNTTCHGIWPKYSGHSFVLLK